MAELEELLARVRRSTGFAERRRFSLARDQALRKLRDFALADPHFYALELVQAAVAGGARVIHADFGPRHSLFAWQGWSLSREELRHLLDHLFASQDRLELARLRHLALGLNALRHFQPREIVLESGDGREAHRLALRPQGPEGLSLELGRADQALDWTYLHAVGLERPRGGGLGRVRDEVEAIETRCLCTPVPILLGLRTPFGPGRQRIPRAWGYHPSVSFDEGDLTGTLGLAPREGLPPPAGLEPAEAGLLRFQPVVRLVTYGVWVQSVPLALVPGAAIGGAVSFDRLRKTADHAAVVRDEVFAEMLARLRPYALGLCRGERAGGLHRVRRLEGAGFAPGELGPWLRAQGRVVVLGAEAAARAEPARRAAEIGRALGAEVVVCPDGELEALESLAGPEVSLLMPALDDPQELSFYAQPPAPPPPEPWLAAPLRLSPPEGGAAASADLFAPAEPGPAGAGVWAQVLAAERCVWQGRLHSDHAGQWLVVRLPDGAPPDARRPGPAAKLAAQVLSRAHGAQARLAARVLAGLTRGQLDCALPATQRSLLQALGSCAVARFRAGLAPGAPPRLALSLLGQEEALLDLPAFTSLAGTRRSLRELLDRLPATGGLVYCALRGAAVDLEGLDRDAILELTAEAEARLAALLGTGCLCRVDTREVLAEADGLRVRDLALGLRTYPDFPLLVEGGEPAALTPAARRAALRDLTAALCELALGLPGRPAGGQEEDRRQALRHLQWLALGGLARGELELLDELGVADLPLLFDQAQRPLSPRRLAQALAEGPLGLTLAGDLGGAELDALAAAAGRRAGRRPAPRSVATTPFAAQLLARLGPLELDFDFDLSDGEARADPAPPTAAFLESAEVAGPAVTGRVGLPADAGVRGAIVLLDPRLRRLSGFGPRAAVPGLVGALRLLEELPRGQARAAVEDALETALARLVEQLVARLGGESAPFAAEDVARVEATLLAYAGPRLRLTEDALGTRRLEVTRPPVGRILDLPLFPAGPPVEGGPAHRASGRRLLQELCAFGPEALADATRETAWRAARAGAPAHLGAWLDGLLAPGRLLRPGRRAGPPPAAAPQGETSGLAAELAHWLHALGADGAERLALPLEVKLCDPAATPSALDDPLAFEPWGLGAACCLLDDSGAPRAHLLVINRRHRLTRQALARTEDAEALGLLLLAAAGLLQRWLHTLIPEDELAFQRTLCLELAAGRLGAG